MTVQSDTIIKEKTKIVVKAPSKFKAVFVNDEKTTMEFVMMLLQSVFGHTPDSAYHVMIETHNSGSAIAKMYNSFEIGEQEVSEALQMSRSHGYPLQIELEEDR